MDWGDGDEDDVDDKVVSIGCALITVMSVAILMLLWKVVTLWP